MMPVPKKATNEPMNSSMGMESVDVSRNRLMMVMMT